MKNGSLKEIMTFGELRVGSSCWLLSTLQCLISVSVINFLEFLPKKFSNVDVKSVISYQLIIVYFDFIVRIDSHVRTLILDLVSPPLRFTSRDHLKPPTIKTPHTHLLEAGG